MKFCTAIFFGLFAFCVAAQEAAPLKHEAYIWQRAWTRPVREAVVQHASSFESLVVLKAEVSWQGKLPQVVRVPLDYESLKNAKCPIGLALRIGPFPGPFLPDDKTTIFLTELAAALIAEAKSSKLPLHELQIDFDCAESKLDGYHVWVEAIRRKISPVPVTITALPSWLNQSSFERLVSATDGYVLQVHSLERPKDINAPFTLCDPLAAQRAVERAGKFSVPFRVALPTYGYLIAFDSNGRFVGLSAEGPGRTWPEGVRLREVRTDPMEMAHLVQIWTTNRPAGMRGIIWYRLPVSDDILNLRWPTLASIMAARSPKESFRAEPRRVESGLVEISLENNGDLDISSRLAVEVRWSNARLVAGDGLRDFEMVEQNASAARFTTKPEFSRLPAGEKRVVGWLRFDKDCEVQVEVKKN